MSGDMVKSELPNPGLSGNEEIQELAELLGVEKTLTGEELLRFAVLRYEYAHANVAAAGIALLKYRIECPHGEYLPFLEKHGISSQRASEMTRIGERLLELPRAKRLQVATLAKSKLVALARFTANQISYAMDHGELEHLATMSHSDATAWRKKHFGQLLEREQARHPVEVPDVDNAPLKPRALEAATDELLGAVSRAFHEIDRAKQVVNALLPPNPDEWKPARVELAHAADLVIRAIAEQAQALDGLLHDRFGVAVTRPMQGEYRTLPPSLLVAINNQTGTQADADTNTRAKQRHARLKWRGAPPKTLEAVIAAARNGDRD